MRDNWKKIKLLCLWELLKQETDEHIHLKTQEICDKLDEIGIPCDRRTLSQDIQILNNYGFEVMREEKGKAYYFYVADRSFDIPEIKILMDSVEAAKFVTDKKSRKLIGKLANLAGANIAKQLMKRRTIFNTGKHRNESIYYNINYIDEAIRNLKQICFKYFDIDENHNKVFRHNNKTYIVEPIAMVLESNNYYLMAVSPEHDGFTNYRIDKMDNVTVLEKNISRKNQLGNRKIAKAMEQTFKMYGGEVQECTLEFDTELIGIIYDKFGEDTEIKRIDSNTCLAKVEIQVSPTFWGWLFQFVGRMKIVEPSILVNKYKERCQLALNSSMNEGEKNE